MSSLGREQIKPIRKLALPCMAAPFLLASCGLIYRAPITGKYEYRPDPETHLELLENHTYRLCVDAKPCETGIYDIEAPRAFADGTFRLCSSEHCGKPFTKKNYIDITRIYFDPSRVGPMTKFNYPEAKKHASGENFSNASNIWYTVLGQPWFTFTDPDSGYYFWRVSD